MSYLAFHSRAAVAHLPGRQVSAIVELAQLSLEAALSGARYHGVRNELGLPRVDSPFFESQVLWLMMDGQGHRVGGHDVYLIDLARQVLYEQNPEYGVLCWLFGNASEHGWVASGDRAAMAGEIDVVLDGGPPILDRAAWGAVTAFLRDGTGDIAMSSSDGEEFPDRHVAWKTGAWRPLVRNTAEVGDELEGLWADLSDDAQWDLSMGALKGLADLRWQPGRYQFSEVTLGRIPGVGGGLVRACLNYESNGTTIV